MMCYFRRLLCRLGLHTRTTLDVGRQARYCQRCVYCSRITFETHIPGRYL